ncbi:MAG: translation initiation factor IF-2 subunit beta [Candidatus Kariarchaeaceae archaeon]|jgi:translation initiation factor 2 subunit 2
MWTDFADVQDEIYDKILKRAKEQLPEHTRDDARFIIPAVDSQIEGNRTFFRNFRDIVSLLNRPDNHFLKFLTNELGTSGNLEGNRVIFQGKHLKELLVKLLDRYVNDYVVCPECGKPDTKFTSQGRVMMLTCEACGASSGIRAVN